MGAESFLATVETSTVSPRFSKKRPLPWHLPPGFSSLSWCQKGTQSIRDIIYT